MHFRKDACALLLRRLSWNPSKHPKQLVYAAGFVLLMAFLFASEPFWLTNDDVSMSMIANGTGISSTVGRHLVLSNIAWGYLISWLPRFEAIQPYTLMTYLALGLSYLAILYALMRSRLNPLVGAILLLIIYAPTLVYPQYTLLAGYLACAGVALLCLPPEQQSNFSLVVAGTFIVISGLVRADETLLVLLAATPLGLGYWLAAADHGIRHRWLIMLVFTGVVFIGFQVWDYLSFSAGAWAEFGHTYALRTEFTDFNLAGFYRMHPHAAALTGPYSANDMRLFQYWFYADPTVFSVRNLGHLMHSVPLSERLDANLRLAKFLWEPFSDPQIQVLTVALVIVLLVHRPWKFTLAAIAGLILLMLLMLILGRPGITRIYVPVFAALALAGAMQPIRPLRHAYALPVIACLMGAAYVATAVHARNVMDSHSAYSVHMSSCRIAHAPILVVWGSDFPYEHEYPPFDPAADACPLRIYSLGEFSLAPFSLDQLHRATRGEDLVQALLDGQGLNFIARDWELNWLGQYFQEHYTTHLIYKQVAIFPGFKVFRVQRQKELPRLSPRSEPGFMVSPGPV